MTTENKEKPITDKLITAYGSKFNIVIETLGKDLLGKVGGLGINFTTADALTQMLYHQACGSCLKVAAVFAENEDPYTYFRDLMDTPGLDEARNQLDTILAQEELQANTSSHGTKTQPAAYSRKRHLIMGRVIYN